MFPTKASNSEDARPLQIGCGLHLTCYEYSVIGGSHLLSHYCLLGNIVLSALLSHVIEHIKKSLRWFYFIPILQIRNLSCRSSLTQSHPAWKRQRVGLNLGRPLCKLLITHLNCFSVHINIFLCFNS